MPDWSLSLAVLIPGLIGLILGSAVVQGAIGVFDPGDDVGGRCRFMPWSALVAMLPAMAVTLQAVGSGTSALERGTIISLHVLGVLLAIQHLSARHSPCRQLSPRSPTPPPRLTRAWSLIGASIGVWVLALDGGLGQVDGGVLVLLCLLYLAWMTWAARQSAAPGDDCETRAVNSDAGYPARTVRSRRRIWVAIARLCMGLTLLTVGARVLAMGVLDLALVLDLDAWMLGLTLVAPVGVLAGWVPILLFGPRLNGRASPTDRSSLWFDFNLVNLLGLVGLTALTAPGGLAFTRETLWVSWPLVILTSLLTAAALARAESA